MFELSDGRESSACCGIEKIIVGTSSLAGLYGAQGEEEARSTIGRALERGFRNFDTAPHYGLGVSEARLGRALRQYEASEVRIWTKVGRLVRRREDARGPIEESNAGDRSIFAETPCELVPVLDYTAAGAAISVAESTERLGLRPFGARVHDPEQTPECEAAALSRDGAFAGLRASGLEVSVGTNDPRVVLRALDCVDAVMLANCWNLVDQNGADALAACAAKRIPVHLAGVYASGLLVGRDAYKYGPVPEVIRAKKAKWEDFAEERGLTLKVVALAFAFQPAAVSLVALGLRTAAEVDDTLDLLAQVEGKEPAFWRALFLDAEARGLLAPGALAACCHSADDSSSTLDDHQ
ncbi:hypothetical protein CTAYLR_010227 [Chrysophaeum taylorii]|uniref:NADP-dependent oxidoreductase domain-containing protein n=1 Tax=Chrysophaeum taylorii TaxID=2483200 RepID=A0AAD7U5M9_9STRA|nr:hypothetical protein CTAYLR_010227 [Chrysophaeum taylorii]